MVNTVLEASTRAQDQGAYMYLSVLALHCQHYLPAYEFLGHRQKSNTMSRKIAHGRDDQRFRSSHIRQNSYLLLNCCHLVRDGAPDSEGILLVSYH